MSTNPADIGVAHQDDNDFDRLLHRFASQPTPTYGVPIASEQDGRNILRVLLQEIDETMLPRRLTLQCRPSGTVTVVASNRRLSAIEISDGPQTGEHPKPTDPTELAKHHASTLSRVFAQCSQAVLLPPERVSELDGTDCSCSARLVAEAAELNCFEAETVSSLDSFIAEAKSGASAWIQFDSGARKAASYGSDELADLLEETYRTFRACAPSSGKPKFRTCTPECTIVPISRKECLVTCSKLDECFLALVPAERTATIWKNW